VGRQTERGTRSNLKNCEKQQVKCHNQLKEVRKAIERLTRNNRVKLEKQLKDVQEATKEMQEENKRSARSR
jgi:Mg2+ and Co2+ transporter CorA